MKQLIQTAALSLAFSLFAANATAAPQITYNRGITNVEVRPSQEHGQDFYDLVVALEFNMAEGAPFDVNQRLDLSTNIEVFVDGLIWDSTPLHVMASNGDNGYPTCDQWQPCDSEDCGVTEVGGDWFSNQCLPPYINGGTGPCMCTAWGNVDVPNVYVDPTTVGDITVALVSAANQLAEVHTDDDSYTAPFIGANYCRVNPNSTGAPARIRALGSRSVQENDLTLVASPLPTNQFGIFFYGPGSIDVPFGDGYRCVGGQIFRLPIASAGSEGVLSTQLDLTNPAEPGARINAGDTRYFQAWYRDPAGGGSGYNLSDGYMIAFIP